MTSIFPLLICFVIITNVFFVDVALQFVKIQDVGVIGPTIVDLLQYCLCI